MILSDLSVRRPVLASVISILLIVFGFVALSMLPLRKYPDIDPPVVTIETLYPGASANAVETQITEVIEERIAGVEGIRFISSKCEDGLSAVTIEFDTGRDVDGAANDIRDRVSAILGDLPEEADPPEIQKVDSNNDVIMWLNLVSDRMKVPELTDYADRYLVDKYSVLNGVARVRIGGGQSYATRIWLDRKAMAARNLVVSDIENALRAENLELPADSIESSEHNFTVRIKHAFLTAAEFERLVLARGNDGYLVRLGDIARVERCTEEDRTFFRGNDWDRRRSAWAIMSDVRARLAGLPGVRAFPIMRQGFGASIQKPMQFVIGGGTYEELAQWRDTLLEKIEADNPGLVGLDWDYKETTPQLQVNIDYDRSAELGITIQNIGRTLETMLGSRRVTTYIDAGEQYDVTLEGERARQRTPTDLQNIYVRSSLSSALIPLSNLVTLEEFADSKTLNRQNRVRAITIEANLADNLCLGAALTHMKSLVKAHLPEKVIVDFKGQSQDYKYSTQSIVFVLLLGIVVVFLVLAAQFESYINPFVIMLTVPLAIAGGLLGLYLTDSTLNLYSQIGLVMLVGLAAKNGILIVEFTNQLRHQRVSFYQAILKSAEVRLRPTVMTGITTAAGSLPLILSSGAGVETRMVIGILSGVLSATFFTLFIVPVAYSLLSKKSGAPEEVGRILEKEQAAIWQRVN